MSTIFYDGRLLPSSLKYLVFDGLVEEIEWDGVALYVPEKGTRYHPKF